MDRLCEECGEVFEAGRGLARGARALTCSKVEDEDHRRSRDRDRDRSRSRGWRFRGRWSG